ncbi:MAG: SPOR domain-containing protein [Holosporales bacterium]|jgi:hypothetical protein|nr:SPOR domain-containing protein [Holosporales bacterium]
MLKLFKKKRGKTSNYFFDNSDVDPWELSTVSFFRDKKLRKTRSLNDTRYRKLQLQETNDMRELSFHKLDESFARIQSAHLINDINMPTKTTCMRIHENNANIKINPNQRLFDVYPDRFFDRNDTVEEDSNKLTKQVTENIAFPHFLKKIDDFYDEKVVPNKNNASLSHQSDNSKHNEHYINKDFCYNSVYNTNAEKTKSVQKESKKYEIHEDNTGGNTSTLQKNHKHYETSQNTINANSRLNIGGPHKRNENGSTVHHDARSEREDELSTARDYRFLLKIAISGFVLVFCSLMLWWIGQQNKTIDDDDIDNVAFIQSPKTIKIRPEESEKSIVPYQDALIYGKIGDSEEDDDKASGERLLPLEQFAPRIVIEGIKDDNEINGRKNDKMHTTESESKYLFEDSNGESANDGGTLTNIGKSNNRHITQITSRKVSNKNLYIQLGSLASMELAKTEARRLAKKYKVLSDLQIRIRPSKTFNGKIIYQLLVGPIDSEMKVKEIEKELGIK